MLKAAAPVLIALWVIAPASGHHAGALGEPVTIEGVVTAVRMVNPHAQIRLAVSNEAGETLEWIVSTAPPAQLRYLGWTSATVPVGSTVRVLGRPAGLGERVIDLDTIEFADGRVIAASLALRLQPGGVNR